MALRKTRAQRIWLMPGWRTGTSTCRRSWEGVRKNMGFTASSEVTLTSPAADNSWMQQRAAPSSSCWSQALWRGSRASSKPRFLKQSSCVPELPV